MQCIGTYPVDSGRILPYCGRQVIAVTHYGDVVMGVLDGCQGENLVLKPFGTPGAGLAQAVRHPKVRTVSKNKGAQLALTKQNVRKAQTNFFPFGRRFGAPFFGAAAALAFTIPFILLASLFVI